MVTRKPVLVCDVMKAMRRIVIGFFILSCFSTAIFGSVNTISAAGVPAKQDQQRLRWKNKTIKVAISSSLTRTNSNIKYDSDVTGAIRRSLEAWANAADIDLQLEFSDKQSVSRFGAVGDGVSLITIAQTAENILFFSKDADLVSAKTRVFFNRKGYITEADIVLNPLQQFSTDGTFGTFDLESTLTHEIGHLLGLKHSTVLSSTMADSFAENGAMGVADLSPRTLSDSDVAAIRELYGAPVDAETCCGVISGKLYTEHGKPGKELEVWAEEKISGRVVAQTDTLSDGTFRLGGLPDGEYVVYWRSYGRSLAAAGSKIGSVTISAGEGKILNEKVFLLPSGVSVGYLGLNGQIANQGVSLKRSRAYVLTVGGKDLNAEDLQLRSSSSFLNFVRLSAMPLDFGDGITGASFMVTVDPDIEIGQYSIFASDDGIETPLIGALNIE